MEIEEHPRNKKVPIPDRWEIVHLRRQGHTFPDISQLLSRAESTCKDIYQRWIETGDVEDSERSGRPAKYTQKEKNPF